MWKVDSEQKVVYYFTGVEGKYISKMETVSLLTSVLGRVLKFTLDSCNVRFAFYNMKISYIECMFYYSTSYGSSLKGVIGQVLTIASNEFGWSRNSKRLNWSSIGGSNRYQKFYVKLNPPGRFQTDFWYMMADFRLVIIFNLRWEGNIKQPTWSRPPFY